MIDALLIYNRIKKRQESLELSNNKFLQLAGVSHSVLDNWKKRQTIPSVAVLEDLCEVLNITVSQLLEEDDAEYNRPDTQRLLVAWQELKEEDKRIVFDLINNMKSRY